MSRRALAGRAALELGMVFLGVMAAFAVEGWRTDREERAQERQYLERLAADLRSDSATIDRNWTRALEIKVSAIQAIGPYVRGQSREIGDTLAFIQAVAMVGAGGFTAWAFQTPTMEDLTATGNLRLIRDTALRAAISEHYRLIDSQKQRIAGRLPFYPMAVHALFPAEARSDLTMELLRAYGVGRILARIRTESFQDVLNQEENSALFQTSVLPGLGVATRELLVAVDAERARLGSR